MRKILCAIIGLFAMTAHAATTDVCDFDIANIYKVGTPTITNAGIYTTNSSESYIRTQNDVAFATANTWSFKWRFTYHPANSDQGIMSGDGGTNVQAIINSEGRPRFSFGNDTGWNAGVWNDTALTFAYQDGVTYDNEIYFDGTRYGFKVNGTEIGGIDSTTKAANTYFAIGVERGRVSAQYSRAEWDLTHTSLTLDGVEQLPWCGKQIKVATTKYVETQFSDLGTRLAAAVATVNTVVTNTIAQAASIATLQSGKQTRPADDTCPAGKKCLLVTDENNVPHWYEIFDPINRWMEGWIAAGKRAPNTSRAYKGDSAWRHEYIDGSYDTTDKQFSTIGGMYKTLTDGEWADEASSPVGVVYGTSKCTSIAGINNVEKSNSTKLSELSAADQAAWAELPAPVGQTDREGYERAKFTQCWCKASGLGVPGADGTAATGATYSLNKDETEWVFYYSYASAEACIANCAAGCAQGPMVHINYIKRLL